MEAEQPKQTRNYDLRELLKPYANKWVALSRDHRRVLAGGDSLKQVASIVRKQSKEAVFMKVFPADSIYIPTSL